MTTSVHKKRSVTLANELFKNRKIQAPPFILEHAVFKTPHPITKVFSSIGIPNFKEECTVLTPGLDLNKTDNFVSVLIRYMHSSLLRATDELQAGMDSLQFLFSSTEERVKSQSKIDAIDDLKFVVEAVCKQLNPTIPNQNRIVQNVSGKIALKLYQDVLTNQGKILYKKDVNFTSIFAKFKEQFRELDIPFIDLDAAREFKNFNSENIPNKKNLVVFSSGGEEGAWDLLTMSMRGIKSCQRWDGEYPRCLIGSILSKYIGIIYLTSGADYEGYGTKMIRRCLVRYAIDAIERKPCILIDKMYTEAHDETIKLFIERLQSKTKLPVYYTPNLRNKTKHLYIPFEKIRSKVSESEWSYQDTALKTDIDLKMHILSVSSNEDYNRYINSFQAKLVSNLSESLRKVFFNPRTSDKNVYQLAAGIRLDNSFDRYSDNTVRELLTVAVHPDNKVYPKDPKALYRTYLISLLNNKKVLTRRLSERLRHVFPEFIFTDENHKAVLDFIWKQVANTIKHEIMTGF